MWEAGCDQAELEVIMWDLGAALTEEGTLWVWHSDGGPILMTEIWAPRMKAHLWSSAEKDGKVDSNV